MTVKTPPAVSGKPVMYKLPPKIVFDEDRKLTDAKYLIVFCLILVVWLALCGSAFYRTDKTEIQKKVDERLLDDFQRTEKLNWNYKNGNMKRDPWFIDMLSFYFGNYFDFDSHYREMGSTFVWASVLFCSLVLILGMWLLAVCARFNAAGLFIISSTLITVSIAYHSIKYYLDYVPEMDAMYTKFMYWIGPEAVLFVFSLFVLSITTKTLGASKMWDMVKTTFIYYLTCRYVVLVGFLVCFIIVLVNAFTAKVLDNVIADDVKSRIIYWVIYSGSIYMIVLIHIFGRVIISAVAAAYYWDQNRGLSPFKVMCKKIFVVTKYQFGGACNKATYTSMWFTLLMGPLMGYEFSAYKLARYCLIFDLLVLLIIDYTVYFIGIFGLPAAEATEAFFRIFEKSKKWVTFACQNFWSASFYILIPTNCLMLILMWGLDEHSRAYGWVSTRSYAEILCVFLPIIYVLGAIEDARGLCIMGESVDEQEAVDAQVKAIEKAEKLKAIKEEPLQEEPTEVIVINDSRTDTCAKPEQ